MSRQESVLQLESRLPFKLPVISVSVKWDGTGKQIQVHDQANITIHIIRVHRHAISLFQYATVNEVSFGISNVKCAIDVTVVYAAVFI